jgi:hypothetical protein
MKIQLITLAIILSTVNAFAPISSAKRTLTFLNADVNYMWAFDAYGRPDGELPSPEVMYGEGDPWYFKASSSGVGQSDFYPLVSEIGIILLPLARTILTGRFIFLWNRDMQASN